jgi:nucleoside-diphosphate-sugar epimerase
MKALVTGGGGFLGVAICARLLARGVETVSYSRQPHAKLDALGAVQRQGDITDRAALGSALQGVDCVFHVAAKVGMSGTAAEFMRVNVEGTRALLDACRASGVRHLVFTSSPSVVFDGQDQDGIDESAPYPRRYLADYPRTKALAEQLVLAAAREGLIRAVALRPHLIWGPGDPHLVPGVLAAARQGRLALIGGGDKLVDAVYVDNAADAHLAAMDKLMGSGDEVVGRAFFVTNHEPWPMRRILNGILAAAGLPQVQRRVPAWIAYSAGAVLEGLHGTLGRDGEPKMTRFIARQLATAHWYDPKAARELLGYRPRVTMEEGLARLRAALAAGGG